MRYVGYVRISSEDQRGNYSLDAQKHAIRLWVAQQKNDLTGVLSRFYEDEAFTGTTDDRPAFQDLVRDAHHNQFDAIIVHKFDRLARNRRDASVYKSLFRADLGIKVFSVTELSEDEDSLAGMLTEGVLELVAEWYSRNLSTETKKGKREKAFQGKHNNLPPFGYDKTKEGILTINEPEAAGVRLAYEEYSTGKYSDREVAKLLNDHGFQSKTGSPFGREMVRPMLQNRTYLGEIRYTNYRKQGNGRRDKTVRSEWFKGKHSALITQELFDRCQHVRSLATGRRTPVRNVVTYPLAGILHCGHCDARMRAQKTVTGRRYYRCSGQIDWTNGCEQKGVLADLIEQQVGGFLSELHLPDEYKETTANAIGELIGQENLGERIDEIKGIIDRLDYRWDMGFIQEEEYVKRREELKAQLAQLQPIARDELVEAHKLLKDFKRLWNEGSAEDRQRIMKLVLERAWVQGEDLIALWIRPQYLIWVREGLRDRESERVEPANLPPYLLDLYKKNGNFRLLESYRCGSDGDRTRDLGLDRAAC